MDVLSETLRILRFRGQTGYHAVVNSPWGFAVPEDRTRAPFYVVTQGTVLLEIPGARRGEKVNAGDLVLISHGDQHNLKDRSETKVVPLMDIPLKLDGTSELFVSGNDAAATRTTFLAGSFALDGPEVFPVLGFLEPLVVVRTENGGLSNDWDALLGMLCDESRMSAPGAAAAMPELLKLLFIKVLRRSVIGQEKEGGCQRQPLALMFDRGLQGIVELLHQDPGRPWTVASMAFEAHMSRTTFSNRFTSVGGITPQAYLTRLRMMKAVGLLESTNATLFEISRTVGYGSEPAFSSAFKRTAGLSPGAYRRRFLDSSEPGR